MNRLIFLSIILIVGCAPSFSEYQTADVLGLGNIGLNIYTSETFTDEEEFTSMTSESSLQKSNGVRFSYGLNNKLDAQFEYEKINGNRNFAEGSISTLGVKYNLFSNKSLRISTCIPFSFGKQTLTMPSISLTEESSSNSESQDFKLFEPVILLSVNFIDNIDFNFSTKLLKQIDGPDTENAEDGYAMNFSSSFSLDKYIKMNNLNVSLIPEYGLLSIDELSYSQYGIALSIKYYKTK